METNFVGFYSNLNLGNLVPQLWCQSGFIEVVNVDYSDKKWLIVDFQNSKSPFSCLGWINGLQTDN